METACGDLPAVRCMQSVLVAHITPCQAANPSKSPAPRGIESGRDTLYGRASTPSLLCVTRDRKGNTHECTGGHHDRRREYGLRNLTRERTMR